MTKHIQIELAKINKFLIKNADAIQKLATLQHKEYLGGKKFRSEYITKYQQNHIKVVKEFANNLKVTDIKRGVGVFKKLGIRLAKDSVRDGLTIEEAVDGIIFIKQAVWDMLHRQGFLKELTTQEFYEINKALGTYCDVISSKIAFTYHRSYKDQIDKDNKKRTVLEIESSKIRDNLENSQKQLQLITDNLPVLISYIDAREHYRFANKEYEKWFGKSQRDIYGKTLKGVLGKEAYETVRPYVRKVLNGHPVTYESLIPYKTGERNIKASYVPHFEKKGKVKGYFAIITNITEQKRIENNMRFLAEASSLLASSLDYQKTLSNVAKLAVPEIADWCAIDLLDAKGGLKQVAVAHKDPSKVRWAKELRKTDPPNMNAPTGMPKVIRTGKAELYPQISDEMLVKAAKSKKQLKLLRNLGFTSAMIVPLCHKNKCIGGITFVTTETKRNYNNKDLAMARELANRASVALENAGLYKASQDAITLRDDFISVASHELKTPVTSVKMFTQVLKKHSEQIGDEKAVGHLSKMDKQLNKLTELIYDLLNISKIQAGKMEFKEEKFDFDKAVKEVVDVLQQSSSKHKIKLLGETKKTIRGDEERLGQVINNLISNAIKYSPKSDKIEIRLSSGNGNVAVAVRDFGIGMSDKHLGRIFERFYRVYDTTDKTFPGLGIGLYISSEIIRRHGGKLWVESGVGHGSTFYFSLPINGKKDLKIN